MSPVIEEICVAIALFCTGFVEVALKALSTVTLVAPVAIPFNFVLSAADIKPAVVVVAASYVVSFALIVVPDIVIFAPAVSVFCFLATFALMVLIDDVFCSIFSSAAVILCDKPAISPTV